MEVCLGSRCFGLILVATSGVLFDSREYSPRRCCRDLRHVDVDHNSNRAIGEAARTQPRLH